MINIAITQRLYENEYKEIRETLDVQYCNLLNSCDFLPIILPYEVEFKKYFEKLNIQGVVLSGGNDLYTYNKDILNRKRDIYEKKLICYCIEKNIPILGICRGMQIITEYFGGSLKKVDDEVNVEHKIIANKDSKYYNLLKNIDIVKSFHNFAIDRLPEEFVVSAKNERNVIKAIEHNKYKIFAQMWHSERKKEFDKKEISLIRSFFMNKGE